MAQAAVASKMPVASMSAADDKIIALVPKEYIKRIPFFVRKHAASLSARKVANEYPELYAEAAREGVLSEEAESKLRPIITGIYEQKMKKHNM